MNKLVLPNRLRIGDTVALLAPAFQASEEQIFQSVQRLEGLGLKVLNLAQCSQNDGYFASSAVEMVEKLHQSFADPNVKAIFSARGGYGCARLLPFLDWDLIAAHPKIVIGFSDLTGLLIAIRQRTGLVTFHGPSASLSWAQITQDSLREILFSDTASRFDYSEKPTSLKGGRATGELIGGNLSVLVSLIGSGYLPSDWSNKILFLEDVHEEVYRVDRMLTQLKLAHILSQIKGLVFGRFNDCPQKVNHSFTILEVQQRLTQDLKIPVLTNMLFGHQPEMFTFPIGAMANLNADEGYLELIQPVVK